MSEQKNSYSFEDLIECAKGNLFGPGNAQLPLPPMLMLDRIVKIDDTGGNFGKGEVMAEFDIKPDLWFFSCHFKGDPVMPGCLGLDALWQMLGFFLTAVVVGFSQIILLFIPILGWLAILGLWISMLVLWIMGLISAVNGQMKPMPVMGPLYQKWFSNTFD